MEEKTCSRCARALPLEAFHIKDKLTGQRQLQCKDCRRCYSQAHYRANRETYIRRAKGRKDQLILWRRKIIRDLKSRPCADCGGTFPHYVMEFDHTSGEAKVDAIANLKNSDIGEAKFRAELAKCDVVCANCHRARTYKRRFEAAVI